MPPETATRKRIIIADDYPEMLDAVETQLASDYDVVGKVADGVALVECACRLRPDMLVIDFAMPKMNGIDALRQLRSLHTQFPAIILTMHPDPTIAEEARAAGAQGFVVKSRMANDLPAAVREVLTGGFFASTEVTLRWK